MTRIEVNRLKNRFNLTLSGSFDIKDAIDTISEIKRKVIELKPGFDVVNDIRFLKVVNMAAALKIRAGTKILEEHGAKRIIRVVGGSQIAVKVFAKFSSLFGSKVEVHYVPTIEEANKILEGIMEHAIANN
jgi:hypothetical protein